MEKGVKRRTAKAPVGANAARGGNKWSPGLKHGPTHYLFYAAASCVGCYAQRRKRWGAVKVPDEVEPGRLARVDGVGLVDLSNDVTLSGPDARVRRLG